MSLMMPRLRALAALPLVAAFSLTAACDIALSGAREEATETVTRSFPLSPGGTLDITTTNGRIDVVAGPGNTVEVKAVKVAKAATKEGAAELLKKLQIKEEVTADLVKLRAERSGGASLNWGSSAEVRYSVKVPANTKLVLNSTNGEIEVVDVTAGSHLETVNGQINLVPSNFPLVNWLGATAGYFMAELAWIYYPGIHGGRPYLSNADGQVVMQQVAAGGLFWLNRNSPAGYTTTGSEGTASSLGAAGYFSLTYDNTVIPGWQVSPSIYHQQGLVGYSPGAVSALWMKGVKATTLAVTFTQNPAYWTAGVNFVKYWGGTTTTNPYRDRGALGFYATRTF